MQPMKIRESVRAGWALVPTLLFFTGCAHYEARPLSPDQTAAQFEARTLDDPGLQKFIEQNRRRGNPPWLPEERAGTGSRPYVWDLDTLTLVALYYHPSLDVARAHWATAQAGIRTAGQRPNPAVSAAPQYVSNPAPGDPFWVAAFTFEPTIETAGKRGHRIEEAQQTAESARLSLAVQAWQVRSQLRTSLVDYATARQRVVLLRSVRDAQEQSLKLLEGRLAAGEIGAIELATPRVALIRAQADLTDAQRQVADTRAALAQALGLPLRALAGREVHFELSVPSFQFPVPGFAPTDNRQLTTGNLPAELRSQALHHRADLLAALADYAASQAALQLEIAKQYPDIRLGPGYEYDQGLHKWGLSVATDALPVFHRNQGPIAEAEAKRSEAAAKFLALQIQVIDAIDRATAALAAAQEQLRQTEALLTAQRQHVQAVEAMVKAGATDQFDLRRPKSKWLRPRWPASMRWSKSSRRSASLKMPCSTPRRPCHLSKKIRGKKERNNGILEYWKNGIEALRPPIIPSFQHSIIPISRVKEMRL